MKTKGALEVIDKPLSLTKSLNYIGLKFKYHNIG